MEGDQETEDEDPGRQDDLFVNHPGGVGATEASGGGPHDTLAGCYRVPAKVREVYGVPTVHTVGPHP